MAVRKRLGEIFVSQGIITEKTVERMLARALRINRKLGLVLEDLGLVTGDELAQALALQYGHRLATNFARYAFAPELLKLIPADEALQCLIFPLKIENGTLALAMADPTETKIVNNIAANNNLKLLPCIATRKDILAAISRHYLGRDVNAPQEKSVLVVEDDQLIQTMLHTVLGREGFRVLHAADGLEGYKMAITESPHVIVTDKEMPKMGGHALLEALQNVPETRHVPVILLTGDQNATEEAKAFEKGFFDYITKPIKEVTVVTRVKRAMNAFETPYV